MSEKPAPLVRLFTAAGDDYLLAIKPLDVVFQASRLRRERSELHGDLTVRVNGHLPHARSVDGILSSGAFNFSSVQTRGQRAKTLAERSGDGTLDWLGFLDEFCIRIGEAERNGRPSVVLSDVADTEMEDGDTWTLGGFPLLKFLPTVIYGLGDSGKSVFSMWLAGQLAASIPVLYVDWEMSAGDHKRRLAKLFDPMPSLLRYVRCERPLKDEVERLSRIIHEHKIQYAVLDSMIFALGGPADDEQAGLYFRAVRSLKIGTLHITHTSKADDEEKSPYGSVFFFNGARSVWYISRVERSPRNELHFGLFHTKLNTGPKSAPLGYKLVYDEGRTAVEMILVGENDELVARLPPLDRVLHVLRFGPKTFGEIADEVNMKRPALKNLMIRHKSSFSKIDGKPPHYGLASSESYEV